MDGWTVQQILILVVGTPVAWAFCFGSLYWLVMHGTPKGR